MLLIVDDDPAITAMLADVLIEEGYQVSTVGDGAAALALMPCLQPDLVLADVVMGPVDGVELCLRAQADPATAAIPIALCSATAENLVRGRCQYVDFLAKPFTLERLLGVVARYTREQSA